MSGRPAPSGVDSLRCVNCPLLATCPAWSMAGGTCPLEER